MQACSQNENKMHAQARTFSQRPAMHVFMNDMAVHNPHALIELGRLLGAKALLIQSHSYLGDEGAATDRVSVNN